jgi:selenide,water dikinase
VKKLLLIGGGHSHIEVIRRFALQPMRDVQLTLVNPTPNAPYSGMLPGLIAGHYNFRQCHIDLPALTRSAGCRFVESAINGVHADAKLAFCKTGETLAYDVAAIDTGSTPVTLGIPGAIHVGLKVKPTDHFLTAWNRLLDRANHGELPPGTRIVIAGGGAAGIEVLLSVQHRLNAAGFGSGRYAVVSDSADILPGHPARARALFRDVLHQRNVELYLRQRIVGVTAHSIQTASGKRIRADILIWATGAAAPAWPAACGLAVDQRGFIRVTDTLQVVGRPDLFASGDVASMDAHSRPKSGVYAVRQGPPLSANLRRWLEGRTLLGYRPQRNALALISTGNRYAVASRGNLSISGAWVWRWKDRIDQRFMVRYRVT